MRPQSALSSNFIFTCAAAVLFTGMLVPGIAGAESLRKVREKVHRTIGVEVYEPVNARKAYGPARGAAARLSTGFEFALRHGKAMASSQPFEHSVALDPLAQLGARSHVDKVGSLTGDYYDWLLWRNGVIGDQFRWRWLEAVNLRGDNVLIGASVYEPERRGRVRYGVAQARGDEVLQLAVLVDSKIAFEELAKHHEPGSTATIRGRFELPVEEPHVLIATDGPEVHRLDLELDDERAFSGEVPLPSNPGRYLVEFRARVMVGEDPSITNVARFPLYVGVEESAEPEPWRLGKITGVSRHMEDWPETLLAVYNREREAHGLVPLELNEAATQLAREWARKLVAGEVSGHRTDAAPALAGAEVRVSDVTQFNSKFYFPTARAETTVQSPYRRMTYLDPAVRSIGIGIVQEKVSGGKQRYRLVELIVAP